MSSKQVVAILTADWHLSLKAPLARSAEPDWLAAQRRPLDELDGLARKHGCPILIAGDVFDRHSPPIELVNWALDALPQCGIYAVPGQHDLPHHQYNKIDKSAYWTLVQAKRINLVFHFHSAGLINVYGFPFGFKIKSLVKKKHDLVMDVAIIHRYVWAVGKGYPLAREIDKASLLKERLKGYDVALTGDNHQPFESDVGKCLLFNAGCLSPRKADEQVHNPSVGLLYSDGHIERHYLDTSKDLWLSEEKLKGLAKYGIDASGFLEELSTLSDVTIDFGRAVQDFIREHKLPKEVEATIIEAVEASN